MADHHLYPSLRRAFPPTLSGYERTWLSNDLVAGLTVWAVLVPESLAYATIAGVSPVVGLYAAAPALIFYALLGSSRQLVVGPMSATAALSAAAVGSLVAAGSVDFLTLTAALAITVGIAALLAGILRLGFVASFISEPVLKGFIIGIALTIIIGQLPKLFGIEGGTGEFFEQAWQFLTELGSTDGWTLATGTASLALILGLRRFVPIVPSALAAVAFGVITQKLLDLSAKGVAIVGPIEAGLPNFGLPDAGWSDYVGLMGGAVGILLIAFSEGIAASKAYAGSGDRIDPNRELLGLGASNLGSGLFSGMVVNGSLSKTAVNGTAGARSQLSGIFVAALTILTLLFFTGFFEDLPEATLAAIVIAAVAELVDFPALKRLYNLHTSRLGEIYGPVARPDLIAAVAALLGVLVFGTLPGLFIGIAVSVLLIVFRASRPHVAVLGRDPGSGSWVDVDRHPDASGVAAVLVIRPESPLFYANADNFRAECRNRITQGTAAVVIDAEAVPEIDFTAAKMLEDLRDELEAQGIKLLVAASLGQVRDLLVRTGAAGLVERVHPSVDEAIGTLQDE